jgi:hypothetical protein
MLDIPVLPCIYLYTKNQTAIECIVDCYIQDVYKLSEAQKIFFGFSCLALLNTDISICWTGKITPTYHKL